MDKFGFVEAVYSFSEGIVIRVTDAADRWFDASFGQTLGVSNGQILPAAVRMVLVEGRSGDGVTVDTGVFRGPRDVVGQVVAAIGISIIALAVLAAQLLAVALGVVLQRLQRAPVIGHVALSGAVIPTQYVILAAFATQFAPGAVVLALSAGLFVALWQAGVARSEEAME